MTTKERFEEVKQKAKNGIKKSVKYVNDHSYEIIAFATIVGLPTAGIIKDRAKKNKKDRTYYDSSINYHWEAKHKLSNEERIRVERYRKEHDANLGEALLALGLLRK